MATKRKPRNRAGLPAVGGWNNTNQMLFDVNRQLQKVEQATTSLELEKVNVAAVLLRIGASLVGLSLRHAELTKRLGNRQVFLAGVALK
jgi:hypothetical protein